MINLYIRFGNPTAILAVVAVLVLAAGSFTFARIAPTGDSRLPKGWNGCRFATGDAKSRRKNVEKHPGDCRR